MSDKIEVGDWVVRDRDTKLHSWLEYGVEYEVIAKHDGGRYLSLKGMAPKHGLNFSTSLFTKKVDTSKRHKYYKEIVAWANGEVIEYKSVSQYWFVDTAPTWEDYIQYRVKPKENPRKVELAGIIKSLKNQLDEAAEEYNTYE